MEQNNLFPVVLVIGMVTLILMVVFFAAGTIVDQSGASERETFTVDDVSSDQTCHLDRTPSSVTLVEYYNGTAWDSLTNADYTVTNNIVTVDASAMD